MGACAIRVAILFLTKSGIKGLQLSVWMASIELIDYPYTLDDILIISVFQKSLFFVFQKKNQFQRNLNDKF